MDFVGFSTSKLEPFMKKAKDYVCLTENFAWERGNFFRGNKLGTLFSTSSKNREETTQRKAKLTNP